MLTMPATAQDEVIVCLAKDRGDNGESLAEVGEELRLPGHRSQEFHLFKLSSAALLGTSSASRNLTTRTSSIAQIGTRFKVQLPLFGSPAQSHMQSELISRCLPGHRSQEFHLFKLSFAAPLGTSSASRKLTTRTSSIAQIGTRFKVQLPLFGSLAQSHMQSELIRSSPISPPFITNSGDPLCTPLPSVQVALPLHLRSKSGSSIPKSSRVAVAAPID
ncbi:hypothetical protein U1Q18_039184 [Sarracenia purpurea var. burkii]